VLYAQDSQINFIVPWSTKPFGTMQVCVNRSNDRVCMDSWAGVLDMAIFGDAQGLIVTLPDGTRTTRVPSGGYFTIYLTGTGPMDGPVEDGGVSGFPLRRMTTPGRVIFSQVCGQSICPPPRDGQIAYAGNSPGLVWGVTQMNVKLPDLNSGLYDVTLFFPSQPMTPRLALQVYRPEQ
jgi:uncharacterized protein (TIGR03437 family)